MVPILLQKFWQSGEISSKRYSFCSCMSKKLIRFLKSKQNSTAIAVHCIAGLGRAPVMVCTSLIDRFFLFQVKRMYSDVSWKSGMEPLAAIDFVRKQRRCKFTIWCLCTLRVVVIDSHLFSAAINAPQLKYLRNYKKVSDKDGCAIQ